MDTMVDSIENMKKQREDLTKQINDAERKLKRCVERHCRIWNISDPFSYYGKEEIKKLIGQYYVIIPHEMIEIMNCENVSSCFENISLVDRDTLMIKVTNRSGSFVDDKSVEKYIENEALHKLRSIEILIENWERGVFSATPEELIEKIKRQVSK